MRKLKYTPWLESLEDRTLLSDGVLDATFVGAVPGPVPGLVTTNLSYINNNFVSPATIYPSAPTHQNSLAIQTIAGVSKFVVAGVSLGPTTAFSVGRFNADGTLDTTFATNGLATTNFPGGTNDQANAAAIQSDGSIIVTGSTTVNEVAGVGGWTVSGPFKQFGLLRYTANGILDTSFGKGGFVTIPTPNFGAAANAVVVQANGRIVVAGTVSGNFGVARVHADGLQDSDFNGNGLTVFNIGETLAAAFIPPTGTTDTLTSMALQPDGQIVVAGYTNLNATKDGLNPAPVVAGVPVTSGSITNATNTAPIIITAPNNNLISGTLVNIAGVGGNTAANGTWTVTVNGKNTFFLTAPNGIAADGTTSGPYSGGGTWTVVAKHAWNFAVARINAQNGLLDASFSKGIVILDFFQALAGGRSYGAADDMAEDVVVQPDGKILVAGRTWMNDNLLIRPNFGIARFNPDGSLDKNLNGDGLVFTDFATDFSDANDLAYSVGLQGDGKIVVAGSTDRLDAVNVPGPLRGTGNPGFALVRYNLDGTEDQTFGLHGEVLSKFTPTSSDQVTNIVMQPNGQIVVAGTTNQGGGNVFALARYSGLQSGSFQFNQGVYSGNENGGNITITVNRGGGTEGIVTVNYAASDGTAKAGTDYTTTTGSLTFATGVATQTFIVPVMSDGVYQPTNKVFNLTLSNPTGGAFLGFQKTATVTIVETDQPGSLAFATATFSASQNGGSLTVTVTRSNGSAGPVGITYATSNGTAVAGTDYTATMGSLSFAAGETSKTFAVPILNSGVFQPNTTFNISLVAPTGGATLGSPNTAVVTIITTNLPGTLQWTAATFSVGENAGTVTLTVSRTAGMDGTVAVNYATSDGTAVAGTDYTATSGTITLIAGQTSATATIAVRDDGVFQTTNKTFNVTLSNPTGGSILGTLSATVVTLLEKDGTPNQLFVAQAYLDLLQRPVDVGGLASWIGFLNAGGTRQQVALGIENSQEYRQVVVNGLYLHYLHRVADLSGLATFTALLAAGTTDEQVAAALAGSQEYFLARGAGTNDGFLTALYQDVLNRAIDVSGRATFTQLLANGASRTQVASMLLGSTEYLTGLVQGFYQQFLRRAADSGGLNAYVTLLQTPPAPVRQPIIGSDPLSTIGQQVRDEDVIALLVGSLEYLARL